MKQMRHADSPCSICEEGGLKDDEQRRSESIVAAFSFVDYVSGIRAVFSPQWFHSDDERQLQLVRSAVGATRFQNQYPCTMQRMPGSSIQLIHAVQGRAWRARRIFYRLAAIVLPRISIR